MGPDPLTMKRMIQESEEMAARTRPVKTGGSGGTAAPAPNKLAMPRGYALEVRRVTNGYVVKPIRFHTDTVTEWCFATSDELGDWIAKWDLEP